MPQTEEAPIRHWTAKGSNRDGEVLVGSWTGRNEAGQWCRRQNETQAQASTQRGSERPLTFEPVPVYAAVPPELVVGLPKERE